MLDLLRHHGCRSHAERATVTGEHDIAEVAIGIKLHMQRDFVAAAWVVTMDVHIRVRQLSEVARASTVIEHHFFVKFIKIHG